MTLFLGTRHQGDFHTKQATLADRVLWEILDVKTFLRRCITRTPYNELVTKGRHRQRFSRPLSSPKQEVTEKPTYELVTTTPLQAYNSRVLGEPGMVSQAQPRGVEFVAPGGIFHQAFGLTISRRTCSQRWIIAHQPCNCAKKYLSRSVARGISGKFDCGQTSRLPLAGSPKRFTSSASTLGGSIAFIKRLETNRFHPKVHYSARSVLVSNRRVWLVSRAEHRGNETDLDEENTRAQTTGAGILR